MVALEYLWEGESKMAETKGERRERKRRKKRYGHKVRGRSVQTLQRIIMNRARKVKEEANT